MKRPSLYCSAPALTAVWSKAPPLTVRCFAGYSGFLQYLQLTSHELATIGINVTKNKIQIQIQICIVQIHYRERHQHFPACETDVSLCDISSLTQ